MKNWKKVTLFVVAAVFVGIQVVRPARTTAPGDPVDGIPNLRASDPEVAAILSRACSDCHSEQTTWPWYSNVAPVSWFVANHVRDGRRHFNMSKFSSYTEERKRKKLSEICDEVSEGGMPLSSYLLIHRDARLSPEDVQTLCAWTRVAAAASVAAEPSAPAGASRADVAKRSDGSHDRDD